MSFLIEVVHCMRILNTCVRIGHWLERMKKKTLKTDMNYWKVSFLYPQIVHDYTTVLTMAHNSYWNPNLPTLWCLFQTTDSRFKQ